VVDEFDTVLVDLDRQFGSLPQYLDIEPAASIFDALRVVNELDEVAIEAFLGRHESGLCVMAGKHSVKFDQELQHGETAVELLKILDRKFQRIVVEVPRHLDVLSVAALERSDHVVMVVQQSVPGIRDGARLKTILCSDLGIESERVKVLVNRYQASLYTELDDIRTAMQVDEVFTVPNDFKLVSESVNMGVPIYQLGRKSSVTNSLLQLRNQLSGRVDASSKNFLSRSISALLRN
jgi:pilus assembly protein CpaE